MNLKKLALESLNEIDFMNNDLKKYTNQSAKEYCFNNIPLHTFNFFRNFVFYWGQKYKLLVINRMYCMNIF